MTEFKSPDGRTILINPKQIAAITIDAFETVRIYLCGINTPLDIQGNLEEIKAKIGVKNEKVA